MTERPDDEFWMRRALSLARRAWGDTRHYPMVGCVLVKKGEKVGEGYFRRPGEPHAEVHALRRAGAAAMGSDAYVSLEPCSHFGTTPPCADALIAAGVKRVVASMTDPNPLVSGKGFKKLRRAGIEVVTGVLEEESRELNKTFVKYILTREPYVFLKAAATLDGKIATSSGDSIWITGEKARAEGHKLRDFCQAVMVGGGTVRADDPELTVRLAGKKRHPRPVIVSSGLNVPLDCRIMKTPAEGGPLIFCNEKTSAARIKKFEEAGAEVVRVKGSGKYVDLAAVMKELGARKIASALIEGGSGLLGSAIRSGLADEVVFFFAPKLLGGDGVSITGGKGPDKIADALGLTSLRARMAGGDIMVTGKISKARARSGGGRGGRCSPA